MSECLSPCTEGQPAGEAQPEGAAGVQCPVQGGESSEGFIYCMAEHGTLVAAEEAPAGSVLIIEQSSLRRGSLSAPWHTLIRSLAELPSSAFLLLFFA